MKGLKKNYKNILSESKMFIHLPSLSQKGYYKIVHFTEEIKDAEAFAKHPQNNFCEN